MSTKILVGLSGGVDSAVAAYLLKQEGYEVSGGFMINYLTEDDSCPTRTDLAVAREVAEFLDIPFFTFDFVAEYEKRVVNYIFDGYKKGLTPNPDVFCNTWIKFDLFREEALSYGFDAVATGHYAQIRRQGAGGRGQNGYTFELLRGIDPTKDQSYFLSALRPDQLGQALFPIGHLLKSEVRAIARQTGLPNADRKDSQGLCFIGKVDFAAFLKQKIPTKIGDIVDTNGQKIGEHDGAFQYTIGQRKGLGIGGGPAWFVVDKDVQRNRVIVGHEDDPRLYRKSCQVSDMNWLSEDIPLTCEAQIRYRQTPQRCTLQEIEKKGEEGSTSNSALDFQENIRGGGREGVESEASMTHKSRPPNSGTMIQVIFDTPQRAITPGQVCVLYDGDRVLGSGIIME